MKLLALPILSALPLLAILKIQVLEIQQRAELSVEINGIQEIRGTLMIAVYQSDETFLTQNAFIGTSQKVQNHQETISLKIPYGFYAISIFQDLNENGELDTNILGIPKEPTGFSKNAKGVFGPPKFEDAAFNFNKGQKVIQIELGAKEVKTN